MKQDTATSRLFHDSLELEYTLLDFFGADSKWYQSAGSFHDVARVREALLAATARIRARLEEIVTADDRLLLTVSLALELIDRDVKQLTENGEKLLDIITHLVHLVAHLLGYDWQMGKPNRYVVFFQTVDQKWVDDKAGHPEIGRPSGIAAENAKRLEIVCMLYDQNLRIAQIARIMKSSEASITDILVRAGKIERKTRSKAV